MANQLGMAEQHSIITLWKRGWSHRRIARTLGIHREMVSRYVRLATEAAIDATGSPCATGPPGTTASAGSGSHGESKPAKPARRVGDSKPAISITGSEGEGVTGAEGETVGWGRPKPAIAITGSSGRQSQCEPYRKAIEAYLEQGLTAQRIWQDLCDDHDFTDGYQSVQRFVRKLRARTPLPFRRMECAAGEEAQIDFGTGAPVIQPNGKRKRPHLFRIVLSHSRKAYSEVVYNQTTEAFIRCIENAFCHFGGVPKTLVVDNLKAAVIKADWFDPDLNPKIQAFAEHYGTVVLPTKPRTPRHKGKIERQVGYAQSNALKGKTFASLQEQNIHLLDWETRVFDLATCKFIRETRDVLLLGPPGTGKSHLVQAIGYQAIKAGYVVLYRSIFDLARDFLHDDAFTGYDKVLAKYLKPDLLIVDDMGMKQLPKRSGEYLFEIIMRRYETRSTIMTSNRPLEDWGKLIGDVPAATAILDRFLHHAELITINGKSYRLKNKAVKDQPGKATPDKSKT